jgi:hypothetical protein
MKDRLSFTEKVFHSKLQNLNNAHFEDSVFGKLPEKVKETVCDTDNDRLAHAHPNLQEYVFCKVMEDVSGVELTAESADVQVEPLNLSRGEIHVLPYATVREYVLDERLQLL